MVSFLFRKLLSIAGTLLLVSAALYGIAMLTPPSARAALYMPRTNNARMTDEQIQKTTEQMIARYGLDQPFLIQYGNWLGRLVRGDLGFSPSAHTFVLDALIARVPATAELIFYSLLVFIPSGIFLGVFTGSRRGGATDRVIRAAAYLSTCLPPFILALVLLSIFWVGLKWFEIGRLGIVNGSIIRSPNFHTYTGLLTIDGFLNGYPDVSVDAAKHLVLPVITASLLHWATLTRVTRAVTREEMGKEYITAARGRGVPEKRVIWKHALPNVFIPAINSSILSVASLITSLFVIEAVFLINGVSSLITNAFMDVPDISLALGFALFSVVTVLLVTTILDILQTAADPLVREQGGSL